MSPPNGESPLAKEVSFIADRLEKCLNIIRATPSTDNDQKALIFMLVEEFIGLLSRAWRWVR